LSPIISISLCMHECVMAIGLIVDMNDHGSLVPVNF